MLVFKPISDNDRINCIHIAVLEKHGFLTKYITNLYRLQNKILEACYEFNKVLLFTSHCNGTDFNSSMDNLTIKLRDYLNLLRAYYFLRRTGKYTGVRNLFKGLGIPYKEEYDYE